MTEPLLKKIHHFCLLFIFVLIPSQQIYGSIAGQANTLSNDFVMSLPFEEDFSGIEIGEMPEHWIRTHPNWAVSNSNFAGGSSAPELRLNYSPSNDGIIRAITPLLDATEVSANIRMQFMHRLLHWSGSYYLKVQTSLDGEEWYDQWVIEAENKNLPRQSSEDGNTRYIPSSLETIFLQEVQGEEFYIAFVFEGNTDNIDRWYIDDISVTVAEDVFLAVFNVLEDSDAKDPIPNAVIQFDEESITTDFEGKANIYLQEDVNYSISVVAEGYDTKEFDFTMVGEDTSVEVLMTDVVIPPRNLRITTEDLDPGDALLTWTDYGEEYEYRYDDGNATGQLGHQNGTLNSVHGSVHRNDALLYEMAWMLTSEGGPHETVKLWVIGLGNDGFPDRRNILYTAEDVPNTDNQWMTYEFDAPVEAPNGFFIAVSYNGFLGLATDDGDTPGYEFQPDTHMGTFNIDDPSAPFLPIEQFGFTRNFLIRAYGENFGELEYNKERIQNNLANNNHDPSPVLIPLDNPIYAGKPHENNSASRSFLGFNIYLNDQLVATQVEETEFLFKDLEEGVHTAGVQTLYTTTTSEIVSIDFEIGEGYFFDVSVSVNPINAGVVTGQGSYMIGDDVTLEAIPNEGYAFIGWTDEFDNHLSDEQIYSFIMPDEDLNYTANFELLDYEVTLAVDPENAGVVTGEGTYNIGDVVTLEAIPNEDYAFFYWADEFGNPISNEPVYSFNMPAENLSFVANFYETSSIIAYSNLFIFDTRYDEVGTIVAYSDLFTFDTMSDEVGTIIAYSDLFTFDTRYDEVGTIVAYSDLFTFDTTSDDSTIIAYSDLFTFDTTSDDVIVIIGYSDLFTFNTQAADVIVGFSDLFVFDTRIEEFEVIVTISPANSGVVTGEGTYNMDEEVTLEAIPNEGYAFVNWTDENDNELSDDPVFSFIMPAEDINITANFEIIDDEPVDLHIAIEEDVIIMDESCFFAMATIAVAGGDYVFTVKNGAEVQMAAGQKIRFLPGSTVESGGYLHAYISENNPCARPFAQEIPPNRDNLSHTIDVMNDEDGSLFFKLYPNPAESEITLEMGHFAEEEPIRIEILNSMGGQVFSELLPAQQVYRLNLADKQPGMYIVRVIQGNKIAVERLIKR